MHIAKRSKEFSLRKRTVLLATLLLGGGAWVGYQLTSWSTPDPVMIEGPVVLYTHTVAILATTRFQTGEKTVTIPRIVTGPFGGKHVTEEVTFSLSAQGLAGYRRVSVTITQTGGETLLEATLGEPEILAFEPHFTPVKFEEHGLVQLFEYGRTSDAGDFITGAQQDAATAFRQTLEKSDSKVLAEARAGAEGSLRKLFPEVRKIVIR